MRYVSTFSGVEAASLAWAPLGWEPVCFSEVDPFPSAVLAHRYPDVPNLGDITKINWKMVRRKYGQIDLVVGGSPCQSFSVAGTRTGLDGASGLMWEYVRCVRELMPRWLLWENVPGALSSSHGEDFRCLLEALDACGYGLAWRVLDAQFFGLAQRRERVFLVGRLGDVEGPCEVLFEPESLRWDTPTSREKRKELAAGAGGGAEASGFRWNAGGKTALSVDETSPTVTSSDPPAVLQLKGNAIDRDTAQNGAWACDPDENGAYTLNATDVDGVLCMTDTQPHSMVDGEVCGALSATMHKDPPVVGFAANQRGEVRLHGGDENVVGAIPASQSGKQVQGVPCPEPPTLAIDCRNDAANEEVSGTLQAKANGGYSLNYVNPVMRCGVVRRLTPRECERLMGMPDDWTKVPYRGKPAEECPDTPRYKAIGNSMAVNVMRWIGVRIQEEES